MRRALVSGATALSLCGCVSSLDVHRYVPATAQVGYPYRLRFTQYQMTLTWRVTACNETDKAGKPDPTPLKLKLSADSKEATAVDPEQYYVIDPRSLQGLFRTTEFTMEWYEDRTPKSITSDVDDQSADAIGNVLQGAAKLAATGLIPAGPNPGTCTDAVKAALLGINGQKAEQGKAAVTGQQAITATAQKAVDDQTTLVTKLTAAATAMGATIDDTTRKNLGQARAKLEALTNVLAIEQANLKKLNDVLTDTKTFTWPETGSNFVGDPDGYAPSADAAKRWGIDTTDVSMRMFVRLLPLDDPSLADAETVAAPTGSPAPKSKPDGTPDLGGGAAAPVLVKDGTPDLGQAKPAPQAAPPQPHSTPARTRSASSRPRTKFPGLPYREPGRVRLIVCTGSPCNADTKALDQAKRLIATTNGLALQAGTMMYLPFRAQTFAHIKNSAGFAQSGVLTSAGTSQLRGAGSGVTQAIKTAGDQASAIVDAARGATTKRLTADTDQAKAEKALSDAQNAITTGPTPEQQAQLAALQTETTIATAQKSLYDAQAALAASKAVAGQ